MNADSLDLAIATIPYFRKLRPDERAVVAAQMRPLELAAGASLQLAGDDAVVLVVLEGEVTLLRRGIGSFELEAGDWSDELRSISGNGRAGVLTAREHSQVMLLGKAAIDHLFQELPVIAVPLLAELGREAQRRNDLTREVALARTSGLPPGAFKALVIRRRRRMQRHQQISFARMGGLALRALLLEPSRRLAFWMFLGAVLALMGARAVVAFILHSGLQGKLFALIKSGAGNPLHVHHFNYGLVIVCLVGLLSFLPRTRRALRTLSFAFGFGVGLVVDEFALLWNLNPDYYQPSSVFAAALVLFALVQIVYFRSLYLAIARRLLAWVQS
jgi:CRP-like cAMP-binding protein